MRSLCFVFAAFLTGVALQGQVTLPVRFTAFAIDVNNRGKSHSGTIDIAIKRWSSVAECDALAFGSRTVLASRCG
jgi:hypothetical protein